MSDPRDLYPTPQIAVEGQASALDTLLDYAAMRQDELSLVDYQLFTGMYGLQEPCTPEAQSYLAAKTIEEFGEFRDAYHADDEAHTTEEFGDYTWTTYALAENIAPFGVGNGVRLQMAALCLDALDVNGIRDVHNWEYDDDRVIITAHGISTASLSSYRPVFFGTMGKRTTILHDGTPISETSDEMILTAAGQSLTDAARMVEHSISHPLAPTDHESIAVRYGTLGIGLVNAWLLSAGLLQRRYGAEAVQQAIIGNMRKVAGRIAIGAVAKADRV